MRRSLRQAVVVFFLVALVAFPLGTSGVRSQDAQPSSEPEVFASATAPADPVPAAQTEAAVSKRQRHVRPDLSLFGGPNSGRVHRNLKLTLFDDVKLHAVLDRSEKAEPGVVSWVGHVAGEPLSDVVVVVKDKQVMAGNITMPRANYTVRWAGDGVHVVSDIDPSKLPEDRHAHADLGTPSETPPAGADTAPPSGPVIDVMIIYSDDARVAAGGTAQIESLVELAVQNANAAYENSGVLHRLRLVHTQELAYDESSSCETNLDRLTAKSDGPLDQVHPLRDAYAADLVVLATKSGDCGGIAWVMQSLSTGFERYGFNVVRSDRLADLVLAHEIGHNMGAAHDQWTIDHYEGGNFYGLYDYSRGYVDPQPPSTWATVMAYTDPCRSDGCTRIAFFSNPNLLMDGVPMGIPAGQQHAADNTRTFNNSAATVANFRAAAASAPGTSNPTSPTGTITSSRPTFTWSKVAGATQYRLWLDGPSGHVYDGSHLSSVCGASACSVTPALTLALGSYVWRVQTANSAGDGPWSANATFTVNGPPGKAVLVSPKGSGKDNPITFTWNAAANADWYQLLVNNSAGVAVIQKWLTSEEVCSGSTCSFPSTSPLLAGSYKWFVQTRNGSIDGPWSLSAGFGVRKPLPATLVSPSGGVTNPVTYRWNVSVNATWYLLWVRAPGAVITQTWFPAEEICSGSTCSVPAPTLGRGSYTWKVKVRNDAGEGPFTTAKTFTVS